MILIIDNYDSFTHNLSQSVAQYTEVMIVRNDKITLHDISQYHPQGIILSPGPGRPEQAGICVELIQQLTPGIPLLGVCLGHQAIAVAFGGKIVQSHPVMHGKQDFIFHHRQGIYKNLPLPFQAGRYHSLIIDRQQLPDILSVEAENSAGVVMGIRHKKLPIYGVQFHPESILTPMGQHLLRQFVAESEQQGVVL